MTSIKRAQKLWAKADKWTENKFMQFMVWLFGKFFVDALAAEFIKVERRGMERAADMVSQTSCYRVQQQIRKAAKEIK